MRSAMQKIWLLVLVASVPSAAAGGVAAAPRGYTLAQCIHAALSNNPDLAAAAADLAGARARLAQVRGERYGEVEYTQVLGLVNQARGNPTSSPDSKDDLTNGIGPFTKFDLSINIPVWTFGKLDAALQAAQDALEVEQAGREGKRAQVIFNTKQLYYSLLLARQLSGVLHDMLDNMDTALRKTQERLDGGSTNVTEIDVLKLKVGRAKFAKGVSEVDGSMDLTRSALQRASGLPSAESFDIADARLDPVVATIEPLDTYLAEGPERRPETRQLQSGLAAQTAKLQLEEAGYYPTVFMATGFQFARAGNRTEQSNPFAYDDFNYARPVGVLGVRWDLNFLVTGAKVEQARAELERLGALQRDAASGLQLEIRRAYAETAQARDSMQVAAEGRKAGRGLMILTVSNFDLGIGEAEELFKALGAYTEASTDYLRAVHDYNVAVAALGKAVGKELTELQY